MSGCAALGLDFSSRRVESDAEALQAAQFRQALQIREAMETHDLTLGMRREEVVSAWGQPHEVESAGGFESGNERWLYGEGLSAHYGTRPVRLVYFEAGRVAGWETR